MKKQAISDGGWIDLDTATEYKEDTYWDGHNFISCATRSQEEHEALYLTRNGTYVLNRYRAHKSPSQNWWRISEEQAAQWLVRNGCESPTGKMTKATAALEV